MTIQSINTSKTIIINDEEGITGSDIIQLPFMQEYRGKGKEGKTVTSVEYVWDSTENNKTIQRGVEISGHGKYGVPTLKDREVLLALQRIYLNKRTTKNILELKPYEELKEKDLFINFKRYELAKEMGYVRPNKNVMNNLKMSIEIWLATTIFSRYSGGLYNPKEKKYITNNKIGFHFLESMAVQESFYNDEDFDITNIKLSKFCYDMIYYNYRLFYDLKSINKINNLLARGIYLLALQWGGKAGFTWMNMGTLINKFPMKDSIDRKYKKRNIKNALKLLVDIGVLDVTYKDNCEKIYITLKKKNKKIKNAEDYVNNLHKYKTWKEIKQRLLSFGFVENEIEELDLERINYIKALLRYIDVRLHFKNVEKPKELFNSYYENNFPIDEKYYNKSGD